MLNSPVANYTNEEVSRWILLRTEEWMQYPTFLAPLYGIFIVYFYGWITFIIFLIIAEFIWKMFIMNNFVSIKLLSSMALLINILKWPLAIIFAFIAYLSHHNIIFVISMLLFPLITYFCVFLDLPYNLEGLTAQAKRRERVRLMIIKKLGVTT